MLATLTIHLHIPACTSLKEKRGRIKLLISRLHREFNVSVAEMDLQDKWDEAVIACAMVGNERGYLESASLRNVMKKIYYALRLHTNAERIYQVTLIDGVPHFHSWLVPRRKDDTERGMKFLARDDSCSEKDAIILANKLREAMR